MKRLVLSIFLLNLFFIFADEDITYERLYFIKIIAFHRKFEIYCTKNPLGYYKYPQIINNEKVYLTYEGNNFFNQCKFDENLAIFDIFYPLAVWTNSKGEMLWLKKKYGPVIDKNREIKNYPYGFGKN